MSGLTRRQLALAVSLSGVGSHPAAALAGGSARSGVVASLGELIAEADRGGLELATLADGPSWPSGRRGPRLPWLDPTLIACRVAPVERRGGAGA